MFIGPMSAISVIGSYALVAIGLGVGAVKVAEWALPPFLTGKKKR